MGDSPAAVLFSTEGLELAVVRGSAVPTGTRALIIAGLDGTTVRAVTVDASGNLVYNAARSSTATTSNVAGSASSVTLLSANTSRLGATVYNDSTATLYLKLGTTASTTSYTIQLRRYDYYEIPAGYTGRIDGIWSAASGSARITELT